MFIVAAASQRCNQIIPCSPDRDLRGEDEPIHAADCLTTSRSINLLEPWLKWGLALQLRWRADQAIDRRSQVRKIEGFADEGVGHCGFGPNSRQVAVMRSCNEDRNLASAGVASELLENFPAVNTR